eukprot:752459-Hanusia_phi.AAC.5
MENQRYSWFRVDKCVMATSAMGTGGKLSATNRLGEERTLVSDKILRMREIRRRVERVQDSLRSNQKAQVCDFEGTQDVIHADMPDLSSLRKASEHDLVSKREEVHEEYVAQKLMPKKSGSAILERLNSLQREMSALRTSTQATRTLLQLRMDIDCVQSGGGGETSETLQEQSNRIKKLIESHMSDIEVVNDSEIGRTKKRAGADAGIAAQEVHSYDHSHNPLQNTSPWTKPSEEIDFSATAQTRARNVDLQSAQQFWMGGMLPGEMEGSDNERKELMQDKKSSLRNTNLVSPDIAEMRSDGNMFQSHQQSEDLPYRSTSGRDVEMEESRMGNCYVDQETEQRSEFVRQVANQNFTAMYGKSLQGFYREQCEEDAVNHLLAGSEMSSAVQSLVLSEVDREETEEAVDQRVENEQAEAWQIQEEDGGYAGQPRPPSPVRTDVQLVGSDGEVVHDRASIARLLGHSRAEELISASTRSAATGWEGESRTGYSQPRVRQYVGARGDTEFQQFPVLVEDFPPLRQDLAFSQAHVAPPSPEPLSRCSHTTSPPTNSRYPPLLSPHRDPYGDPSTHTLPLPPRAVTPNGTIIAANLPASSPSSLLTFDQRASQIVRNISREERQNTLDSATKRVSSRLHFLHLTLSLYFILLFLSARHLLLPVLLFLFSNSLALYSSALKFASSPPCLPLHFLSLPRLTIFSLLLLRSSSSVATSASASRGPSRKQMLLTRS